MTKYHINPKTGEPSICKATRNCPYGDLTDDHYPSKEAARNAFESLNTSFEKKFIEKDHFIPLDSETEKLINLFHENGMTSYIVGGTVRDSLESGLTPKDVDLEIYGIDSMDSLSQFLRKSKYKVDEVGKQFGVLKTRLSNGMDIDLSLPRRDSLSGVGHRGFDIEVNPDLELDEAAERRDFTINALYYNHIEKKIIDPVNGLKDWDEKVLRPVSEAFKEDPLRVLRGVQFASRFGLVSSSEYIKAGKELKDFYSTISSERVQEEFSKLFTRGKDISAGLDALQKTQWGEHFGFNNEWYEKNDLNKIRKDTNNLVSLASERAHPRDLLQASYLARTLKRNEQKTFLKASLIESRKQNLAERLIQTEGPRNNSSKEIKRWARAIGKKGISASLWSTLNNDSKVAELAKRNNSFEGPIPDMITGQKILDFTGRKDGGKWVGVILRDAVLAQDDEVFKDKEGAMKWLSKRIDKTL